jgi:hypothetical protein
MEDAGAEAGDDQREIAAALAKAGEVDRRRLAAYSWTGKKGTDVRTGQRSFEFQSRANPGVRAWLLLDGTVKDD